MPTSAADLLAATAQGGPTAAPVPAVGQWLGLDWADLLRAVLLALGGLLALRIVRTWLAGILRAARVDLGTQILVRRTVSVAAIVVIALLVLGTLGVQPATLLALTGAVGLALSLAVQDILKNFFSGVYLLLERPFRVGDTVKVKDQQGTVENIGVRTTTLRTADNVQVLVPNAIVFAEVVSNHSAARPAGLGVGAAGASSGEQPEAPVAGPPRAVSGRG